MQQILTRLRKNPNTTSPALNSYKCEVCKDTSWIVKENKARRCKCYEIEQAEMMWENFGINPKDVKPLKEYEPYNDTTKKAKEKAIEYIINFDEIKDKRENSFCLMGQAGAGKTHIITAIGRALINKNIPVVYMPYIEAIRELKASVMDEVHYNKVINKYKNAKVLIIDDLFKDKVKKGALAGELKEADLKHIYAIINYRYLNYLPTLISTECTPILLIELDEAIGGRILESCGKEHGIVFKNDCNYRLKKYIE